MGLVGCVRFSLLDVVEERERENELDTKSFNKPPPSYWICK